MERRQLRGDAGHDAVADGGELAVDLGLDFVADRVGQVAEGDIDLTEADLVALDRRARRGSVLLGQDDVGEARFRRGDGGAELGLLGAEGGGGGGGRLTFRHGCEILPELA